MVPVTGRKLRTDPLRPLNTPRPIQVKVGARGEPRSVWMAKRLQPVAGLRDCWRIDDRWWTEQPVSRTYYELELANGEVLTLFHDRLGNQWFEQRAR